MEHNEIKYILISENALASLELKVDNLLAYVRQILSLDGKNELSNDEFVAKLKISKRTAQRLRDEGKISFIQIGRKIYYRNSDIEQYLSKHIFKAFNQ